MRVESEYQRLGTLAYLAAYDVHRAKVIGPGEPTTGIAHRGTAAAGRTGLAQCETMATGYARSAGPLRVHITGRSGVIFRDLGPP